MSTTGMSPMGPMTDGGILAPTTAEVLADPGKYEGTSFDPFAWIVGGQPLLQAYFSSTDDLGQLMYVPATLGEWLRTDPTAALTYCFVVKRGRINLAKLGPKQMAVLAGK